MGLNTSEVAKLQPDYMGFIFYEGSPRNHKEPTPSVPANTKKVGVFVNADNAFISEKIKNEKIDVVQLHGEETPEYCDNLKTKFPTLEIWKVFRIRDEFDFQKLEHYEDVADKYLFDTMAKKRGGTGLSFNWEVLKKYSSTKEFILSGGIGPYDVEKLRAILATKLPIHGIDINSKFEIEPALKNIDKLQQFISELDSEDNLVLPKN